jgi:hypothetical protein
LHIERLFESFPRLKLVDELAHRHRFFHWEFTFADIFYHPLPTGRGDGGEGAPRGGFDLVLGNPPWIKVEWKESGVLGDHNPLSNLRRHSASQLARLRADVFERYPGLREAWLAELEGAEATQAFLNATQNYPLFKGVQTNLYKCFLPQAWRIGSARGVAGFLHPEGVYDDPKGGRFRAALYRRLRAHFQFHNELSLFAEVHHATVFSINVYGPRRAAPKFGHIANLYAPSAVDVCFGHPGDGPVPGIKDDEGKWNTAGHAHRIIEVDERALATFASLYDEGGTPALQARLPALHSRELLSVLEKFAAQPRRLGNLKGEYLSLEMWHETNAQKDGTIRRETRFPSGPEEWVLSGPHFFVGNPFYKTPRRECTQNSHYDVLDLTDLPDDYLPRTNYVPACSSEEYARRTPRVPWKEAGESEPRKVTEYYRWGCRKRLSQSGERTLIPALMAPDVRHIFTTLGVACREASSTITTAFVAHSLALDYVVKSTGNSDFTGGSLRLLPILDDTRFIGPGAVRVLVLNCLSAEYSNLWETFCSSELARDEYLVAKDAGSQGRFYVDVFRADAWTKPDPRLPSDFFANLTPNWHRDCALRTDYARRQALVEIDVLAAMALGLTLDELLTIYRVQFPVLRQYEADTWYDANGRIVFTASKGLPNVGLARKTSRNDNPCAIRYPDGRTDTRPVGWEDVRDLAEGTKVIRTIEDDTLPGSPRQKRITYVAPFDCCDREADYRQAWEVFQERLHGKQ